MTDLLELLSADPVDPKVLEPYSIQITSEWETDEGNFGYTGDLFKNGEHIFSFENDGLGGPNKYLLNGEYSKTHAVWYASAGCLPDSEHPEFVGTEKECEKFIEENSSEYERPDTEHDLYSLSISEWEDEDKENSHSLFREFSALCVEQFPDRFEPVDFCLVYLEVRDQQNK